MILPNIIEVLNGVKNVKSEMGEKTFTIENWIKHHRKDLENNNNLLNSNTDKSKIEIFKKLIADFLMRAMRGERGNDLRFSLENNINSINDLNDENYLKIISKAKYRWGTDIGKSILKNVVNIIEKEYDWNFKEYFKLIENNYLTNFEDDPFLKVKYIGFKVRDLSVSNFNNKYIANDLHVVRISTRIGLLNYGYHILKNDKYEMGNNPSNKKQYLFLHQLFQFLSNSTNNLYSPSDIDRTFWHLGRSICTVKPKCNKCPINNICLTGIERLK